MPTYLPLPLYLHLKHKSICRMNTTLHMHIHTYACQHTHINTYNPNGFAFSYAHLAEPEHAVLILNRIDRPIEQALVEQKRIRRPNRTCRHPDIDTNTKNVRTTASVSVSGCLHVCECVSVLSRQSHFQNALRVFSAETPEMNQVGWPQFQASEE